MSSYLPNYSKSFKLLKPVSAMGSLHYQPHKRGGPQTVETKTKSNRKTQSQKLLDTQTHFLQAPSQGLFTQLDH